MRRAANLACGHHIPSWRSTILLCQLAGVAVSAGWMAGIRGKAAALIRASGFMARVRELLASAPAVHADGTPARAAAGARCVHLACTAYLTHMHTGDRSADAIDAGGVLPGYTGIIVRDGYAGYEHLTGALHAWCGAHLLRDLKALYDFEPQQQDWASQMACLLIEARDAASAARRAGEAVLDAVLLEDLVSRYQALAAAGLAANLYRRTATAKDARRIARFPVLVDQAVDDMPALDPGGHVDRLARFYAAEVVVPRAPRGQRRSGTGENRPDHTGLGRLLPDGGVVQGIPCPGQLPVEAHL
jgi:transposase